MRKEMWATSNHAFRKRESALPFPTSHWLECGYNSRSQGSPLGPGDKSFMMKMSEQHDRRLVLKLLFSPRLLIWIFM